MDAWLILPALRGRRVRRPTMNREKSNSTASHTFPELLDFSTLEKSREWRAGRLPGARLRLRGRPDARHSAFDSFHRGRNIFPWRPGFHALTGIGREPAEPHAVQKQPLEHGGKCINIATGENISGKSGTH